MVGVVVVPQKQRKVWECGVVEGEEELEGRGEGWQSPFPPSLSFQSLEKGEDGAGDKSLRGSREGREVWGGVWLGGKGMGGLGVCATGASKAHVRGQCR